jgi:hypothetical protein
MPLDGLGIAINNDHEGGVIFTSSSARYIVLPSSIVVSLQNYSNPTTHLPPTYLN